MRGPGDIVFVKSSRKIEKVMYASFVTTTIANYFTSFGNQLSKADGLHKSFKRISKSRLPQLNDLLQLIKNCNGKVSRQTKYDKRSAQT